MESGRTLPHVCFLAPEAYPILADQALGHTGGAEIQQMLLARALVERGVRVSFVVADYGQRLREERQGVEIWRAPFRYFGKFGNQPLHFPGDMLRLVRLLKHINAEIYLLKEPVILLLAMALLRRWHGKRIIKWSASDRECRKEDPAYARRKYLQPLRKLYLWAARQADMFIFQTPWQKQIAQEELGLRGEVIANLMPDVANPAGTRGPKDIDALWVGTVVHYKKPEAFLELAAALPQHSFCMLGAPAGDPAFAESMLARIKQVKNLEYPGRVPFEQVDAYYQRARMLVFTSPSEGMPNVCLQAWKHSLPVVSLSLDPGGIIERHKMGLVAGDMPNLVREVKRLLAEPTEGERLGQNGRTYFHAHHSPDVVIPQYLRVFEQVLAPEALLTKR